MLRNCWYVKAAVKRDCGLVADALCRYSTCTFFAMLYLSPFDGSRAHNKSEEEVGLQLLLRAPSRNPGVCYRQLRRWYLHRRAVELLATAGGQRSRRAEKRPVPR